MLWVSWLVEKLGDIVVWESRCLDDGLIRMTDLTADTVSLVEEPELSTRMVWCTALVGRQ
jgi:hypothetical protein